MSKVLLVYDDFAELTAIDYSLKKVGFDVIALTNEFTIKDQVIAFNPDILICSGSSSRVSTISVGKKVKEMSRWPGKSVLIFPENYEIPPDELIKIRMDMMLEAPVPLTRLIQIIAKLSGQDDQIVIDKLVKTFANENTDQQSYLNQDENIRNAIQHIQGQIDKLSDPKGKPRSESISAKESDSVGLAAKDKASDKLNPNAAFSSTETPKTADVAKSAESVKPAETAKAETTKPETTKPSEAQAKKKFSDPFQELMNELSGQKPTEEDIARVAEEAKALSPEDVSEETKDSVKKQLEEHEARMAEKKKKYAELTQNTSLYPESMMKKTKVKKQFNELKKDWDKQELAEQDNLRKEFVKALFKK